MLGCCNFFRGRTVSGSGELNGLVHIHCTCVQAQCVCLQLRGTIQTVTSLCKSITVWRHVWCWNAQHRRQMYLLYIQCTQCWEMCETLVDLVLGKQCQLGFERLHMWVQLMHVSFLPLFTLRSFRWLSTSNPNEKSHSQCGSCCANSSALPTVSRNFTISPLNPHTRRNTFPRLSQRTFEWYSVSVCSVSLSSSSWINLQWLSPRAQIKFTSFTTVLAMWLSCNTDLHSLHRTLNTVSTPSN